VSAQSLPQLTHPRLSATKTSLIRTPSGMSVTGVRSLDATTSTRPRASPRTFPSCTLSSTWKLFPKC
jgi:hypothetical protein